MNSSTTTSSNAANRRMAILATEGFQQAVLTEHERLLEPAGEKVDVMNPDTGVR